MSNALQDQLLKAGLTTEKKLQKEQHAKRKQAKQQKKKKNQRKVVDESKVLAQKSDDEKRQRDRALNRTKEDAAKQKAIIAQIKQLIEANKANLESSERTYNFEDNKIIKHIYVTDALHDQISRGKFAIVKFNDRYHAVPAIVANKIKDRDEKYVVLINDSVESEEIDNEYTDYVIPDDLMW